MEVYIPKNGHNQLKVTPGDNALQISPPLRKSSLPSSFVTSEVTAQVRCMKIGKLFRVDFAHVH
jgi:hypothetical protein